MIKKLYIICLSCFLSEKILSEEYVYVSKRCSIVNGEVVSGYINNSNIILKGSIVNKLNNLYVFWDHAEYNKKKHKLNILLFSKINLFIDYIPQKSKLKLEKNFNKIRLFSSSNMNNVYINENRNVFCNKEKTQKYRENITKGDISDDQIHSCGIHIDEYNNRVIIKKTNRLQSSSCQLSDETYPIKKNYTCDKCIPNINNVLEKVYLSYQRYWIDINGIKHNINEDIHIDKERSYSIKKDYDSCNFQFINEDKIAYSYYMQFYIDENGIRKNLSKCIKDLEPLELYSEINFIDKVSDFKKHWTIVPYDKFFNFNGEKKLAIGTRTYSKPIDHEFDCSVCEQIINSKDKIYIKTGRPYINILGEKKYVSEECFPLNEGVIMEETIDGCEKKFFYDQDKKSCFLKKRWFYMIGDKKNFISPCITSNEVIKSDYKKDNWQHDDFNKRSRYDLVVYVNYNGEDIRVTSYDGGFELYNFIENVDVSTNSFVYEGCYKKFKTEKHSKFKRGDGSLYKEYIGESVPFYGINECKTFVEKSRSSERTIVVYPDGTRQASKWK